MSITRFFSPVQPDAAVQPGSERIVVVGVGGAGCNAVASLVRSGVTGVDLVAIGSDGQALRASRAPTSIHLDCPLSLLGPSPELGRAAARGCLAEIRHVLHGASLCFVAAGMGGATGTGAAPVVAAAAQALGILTIGVATTPFQFEGPRRAQNAARGIADLGAAVDTLLTIPNQKLMTAAGPQGTFASAFISADRVLERGVRSIADLLLRPGLVNLNFADLRSVMKAMGPAVLGSGTAFGPFRAVAAAREAVTNPLLKDAIQGSRRVLVSLTGGDDLRLHEIEAAVTYITHRVHPDADILWGSSVDKDHAGELRISVVATGMAADPAPASPRALARICRIRQHRPGPEVRSNQGFEFGTCTRCGQNIIRSDSAWKSVPQGFRVVWRSASPARQTAARSAEQPTGASGRHSFAN